MEEFFLVFIGLLGYSLLVYWIIQYGYSECARQAYAHGRTRGCAWTAMHCHGS